MCIYKVEKDGKQRDIDSNICIHRRLVSNIRYTMDYLQEFLLTFLTVRGTE